MTAPTPEERAEWQAQAARRLAYADHGDFNDRRILTLLAALEEAEREWDALVNLTDCPTCSPPTRETVGMVCQSCGWDYAKGEKNAAALVGYRAGWTTARSHFTDGNAPHADVMLDAVTRAEAADAESDRLREGLRTLADECANSACIHLNTLYGNLRALLGDQS